MTAVNIQRKKDMYDEPPYRVYPTPTESGAILKAYVKELLKDKQKAKDFLCDAGIYNKDGTLTECYSRTE
jgi:hypothetical protein